MTTPVPMQAPSAEEVEELISLVRRNVVGPGNLIDAIVSMLGRMSRLAAVPPPSEYRAAAEIWNGITLNLDGVTYTAKEVFGVHLIFTREAVVGYCDQGREKGAERVVEMALDLDGQRIEMTYDEFKARLTVAAVPPREPTAEMYNAAMQMDATSLGEGAMYFLDIWRAMYDAAPQHAPAPLSVPSDDKLLTTLRSLAQWEFDGAGNQADALEQAAARIEALNARVARLSEPGTANATAKWVHDYACNVLGKSVYSSDSPELWIAKRIADDKAELSRLRPDAERYQWLRNLRVIADDRPSIRIGPYWHAPLCWGEAADAAIDAALQQQERK